MEGGGGGGGGCLGEVKWNGLGKRAEFTRVVCEAMAAAAAATGDV